MKPNEITPDKGEKNKAQPQDSERHQRDLLRRQLLEEAKNKQLEKKMKKAARRKTRNKKPPEIATSCDQTSARSLPVYASSSNGWCVEQTATPLQNDESKVSVGIFDHHKSLDLADADMFSYTDGQKSEADITIQKHQISIMPEHEDVVEDEDAVEGEDAFEGEHFSCLFKLQFPRCLSLNASSIYLQKHQIKTILSHYCTESDGWNEDLKRNCEIAPYRALSSQNLRPCTLQAMLTKLLEESKFWTLMKKHYYLKTFTLPSCSRLKEIAGHIAYSQKSSFAGLKEKAGHIDYPQKSCLLKEGNANSSLTFHKLESETVCHASPSKIKAQKLITEGCKLKTSLVEGPPCLQCQNDDKSSTTTTETEMMTSCNSLENSQLANFDEVARNVKGYSLVDVGVYQCSTDDSQSETSAVQVLQHVQCENDDDKAQLVPSCDSFQNSAVAVFDEVSHNVEGYPMALVDVAAYKSSTDYCQSETSWVEVLELIQWGNGDSPSTNKPQLLASCIGLKNAEFADFGITDDSQSESTWGEAVCKCTEDDSQSETIRDEDICKCTTDDNQSESAWGGAVCKCTTDDSQSETAWDETVCKCTTDDKQTETTWDEAVYKCTTDDSQSETTWDETVYKCTTDDSQSETAWGETVYKCTADDKQTETTWDETVYKCTADDSQSETAWDETVYKCTADDNQSEKTWREVFHCVQCENDASPTTEAQLMTSYDSFESSQLASFGEAVCKCTTDDNQSEKTWSEVFHCVQCENDASPTTEAQLVTSYDSFESSQLASFGEAVCKCTTDDSQLKTIWGEVVQCMQCENNENPTNKSLLTSCYSFVKSKLVDDKVPQNLEEHSLANIDEAVYRYATNECHSETSLQQELPNMHCENDESPTLKPQLVLSCNNSESTEVTNIHKVPHRVEMLSFTDTGKKADSESSVGGHNQTSEEFVRDKDFFKEINITSDLWCPIRQKFVPENWDDDLLQGVQCGNNECPATTAPLMSSCCGFENSELASDKVPPNLEEHTLADIDTAVYKGIPDDCHSKISLEQELPIILFEKDGSLPTPKVQLVLSCNSLENLEVTDVHKIPCTIESPSLPIADEKADSDFCVDRHNHTSEECVQCEDSLNERDVTSDCSCPIGQEFVPDNWDDDLLQCVQCGNDESTAKEAQIMPSCCDFENSDLTDDKVLPNLEDDSKADIDEDVYKSTTDECQSKTLLEQEPPCMQYENGESSPASKAQLVLFCNSLENTELTNTDNIPNKTEILSLTDPDEKADLELRVDRYNHASEECVQGEDSLNIREVISDLWCPVRQDFVPNNWDDDLLQCLQCENDESPLTKAQFPSSCCGFENSELANDKVLQHLEDDSLTDIDKVVYSCTTDECQSKTLLEQELPNVHCENDEIPNSQLMLSCNTLENSGVTDLHKVPCKIDEKADPKSCVDRHNHTSEECVHGEDSLSERDVTSELWCPVRQEFVPDNWDDDLLSDDDVRESDSICETPDISMCMPVSDASDRALFAEIGTKSGGIENKCKTQLLVVEISGQNVRSYEKLVTDVTDVCDNTSKQSIDVSHMRDVDGEEYSQGNGEVKFSKTTVMVQLHKTMMGLQQQETAEYLHSDHQQLKPNIKWHRSINSRSFIGTGRNRSNEKVWIPHVSDHSQSQRLLTTEQKTHREEEMNTSSRKLWVPNAVYNKNQPHRIQTELLIQAEEERNRSNEKVWVPHANAVNNRNQLQRLQTDLLIQAEEERNRSSGKVWELHVSNHSQSEILQTAEQATPSEEDRNKSSGKVRLTQFSNPSQPQRLQTELLTHAEEERNNSSEKVWLKPVSNQSQPQRLQTELLTHAEEERNKSSGKVLFKPVGNQSQPERLRTAGLGTHTEAERKKCNEKIWIPHVVGNQNQSQRLHTAELLTHQLNVHSEVEQRSKECDSASYWNKPFCTSPNSSFVKNIPEGGIMIKTPELKVSNNSLASSQNFNPPDLAKLKEARLLDQVKDKLPCSTDCIENNLRSKSFSNASSVVNSWKGDFSFHNVGEACGFDNNVHRHWEIISDSVLKAGTVETSANHILSGHKSQHKTECQLVHLAADNVGCTECYANRQVYTNDLLPVNNESSVHTNLNINSLPGMRTTVPPTLLQQSPVHDASDNLYLPTGLDMNNLAAHNIQKQQESLYLPTGLDMNNLAAHNLQKQQESLYLPTGSDLNNLAAHNLQKQQESLYLPTGSDMNNLAAHNIQKQESLYLPTGLDMNNLAAHNLQKQQKSLYLPTGSDLNNLAALTLQKQQQTLYLLLCDLQAKVLALSRIVKARKTAKSPSAGGSDTDGFKNTGSLPVDKELSWEQIEAIIDSFVPVLSRRDMSVPKRTSAKSFPQNRSAQESHCTFPLQNYQKEKQADQRELSEAELDNILKRLHALGVDGLKTPPRTREQSTANSLDQSFQDRSWNGGSCFRDPQTPHTREQRKAHFVDQSYQDKSSNGDRCVQNPQLLSRLPKRLPAAYEQKPWLGKTKQLHSPLFQNKKTNKTISSCKVEADQFIRYPDIPSENSTDITRGLQELQQQVMTTHSLPENQTVSHAKTGSFTSLNSLSKSTEEGKTNHPDCEKSKTCYKFFRGRMVKVPDSKSKNKEMENLNSVGFPTEVGHSPSVCKGPTKLFSSSGSALRIPRKKDVMQTTNLSQINYGFPSPSQRPVFTVSKTLPKKTGELYAKDSW